MTFASRFFSLNALCFFRKISVVGVSVLRQNMIEGHGREEGQKTSAEEIIEGGIINKVSKGKFWPLSGQYAAIYEGPAPREP
jgi:hypothetical protein